MINLALKRGFQQQPPEIIIIIPRIPIIFCLRKRMLVVHKNLFLKLGTTNP